MSESPEIAFRGDIGSAAESRADSACAGGSLKLVARLFAVYLDKHIQRVHRLGGLVEVAARARKAVQDSEPRVVERVEHKADELPFSPGLRKLVEGERISSEKPHVRDIAQFLLFGARQEKDSEPSSPSFLTENPWSPPSAAESHCAKIASNNAPRFLRSACICTPVALFPP